MNVAADAGDRLCGSFTASATGRTSKRQERAAIKKALNSGTFLLPIHDYPARIENQRVVSRFVGDSVPGPEIPVEHRTVSETRKMGLGAAEFRLPPAP